MSKKDMVNNVVQLESVDSDIPQDAARLQKHIALMCDRCASKCPPNCALLRDGSLNASALQAG